jgi:hypothetical protein
VIQIARDSIYEERPLRDVFARSEFLRDFRQTAAASTRGCILLERPDLLIELADRHAARDTTARQTVRSELQAMQRRASQFNPGGEIRERNWVYRLFKRFWFNDYGTYQQYFDRQAWHDPASESQQIAQSPDELTAEEQAELHKSRRSSSSTRLSS